MATPTIREIEDKMVEALNSTGSFNFVISIPKGEKPMKTFEHPAAFVYFESDALQGNKTRPVYKTYFAVIIEHFIGKEGIDTYYLIDKARDVLQGNKFGFSDITAMICEKRNLVVFEEGIIEYLLIFSVDTYLPIPLGWRR